MKEIGRGLPYVIDLMALAMGAGLDFPGAVRQVVQKSSNPDDPLVEEMTLILQALSLVGRAGRRCGVRAARAGRRGDGVLRVPRPGRGARQSRRRRAHDPGDRLAYPPHGPRGGAAAKAGVAMGGPLLLVFAAIMLLVVGPMNLQLENGSTMGGRPRREGDLRFQIRQPDGHIEQLVVEGERVMIGAGAHCEIRLPVDQSALEAVLVQQTPSGVYAKALCFDPPPTLNNIPFNQAPVQAESILGVGQMQIYVTVSEETAGGAVVAKAKAKTSPMTVALVLLCGAAAGYYFFAGDDQAESGPQPHQVPELWDATPQVCPQSAPEQALARAHEIQQVADARRERRPFHVQDGVAAVPLYELRVVLLRTWRRSAAQGRDRQRRGRAQGRDAAGLPYAPGPARSPPDRQGLRLGATGGPRAPRVHGGQAGGVRHLALEPRSEAEAPGRPRDMTQGSRAAVALADRARFVVLPAGIALAAVVAGCMPTPADHIKADMAVMKQEGKADKLIDRGKAFASVGDTTRAEQYFAAAMASGADERVVIPLLLTVCARDGRYRVAIQYAEGYLKEHPGDLRVRFVLGTLYAAVSEPDAARDALRVVVDARPEDADAHFALGVLLRDSDHDYAGADRQFREYIRLKPRGPHAEEAQASLLKSVP